MGDGMVEFEMTEAEYATLLAACQPTPAVSFDGVPMPTPQEKANAAWRDLAAIHGFDWATVRPIPGKSERWFTARRSEVIGFGPS